MHFLTTRKPAKLFVRASYPEFEECPEVDSETVIRYTATVEPTILTYEWPKAEDMLHSVFQPIYDEQTEWITIASEAKADIDSADALFKIAESELLLEQRKNEINLKRSEDLVGTFKVGREGDTPRHLEWWENYRTDRQEWIKDLDLEIEQIQNSDISQDLKNSRIASREKRIASFADEMNDAVNFIIQLEDLEAENLAQIGKLSEAIKEANQTIGLKAKLSNTASKLKDTINSSKLNSAWVAKAAKYGGATLEVVGVALDIKTIVDAESKIAEIRKRSEEFKDVPDNIKQKLEDLVVSRPNGPVTAGKYMVKTIPGDVDFTFLERNIIWTTEEELFDKDGFPIHEEEDSSGFKHFATVTTTDASCYGGKFSTSDGGEGYWQGDTLVHGNIGSSIVDALDHYTEERLEDHAYVIVTATGSTEAQMLAAAEVAKSEADRNSEIMKLRWDQVLAGFSLLATGLIMLAVAMSVLTAGLGALILAAIGAAAFLVSIFSEWFFTSPLVTSIENLYPGT